MPPATSHIARPQTERNAPSASLGMTAPSPLPAAKLRRLKEMIPSDVLAARAADPRLIIPVGTCEQHGPHLPLGCDTIIVERLADDLSAEFAVLRAPTVEFEIGRAHV